jgi:hypothetical protein
MGKIRENAMSGKKTIRERIGRWLCRIFRLSYPTSVSDGYKKDLQESFKPRRLKLKENK